MPSCRRGIAVIATWYAIMSLMLVLYVVLDGRNFGAGMLHSLVARTPDERRQVIASIGPLWSWHEVWLVGFGGTLLAVFPRLIASAFAGYYLALLLIFGRLILRGIAIEVRGHINDPLWQGFWDFIFTFSNFLLAIIFGAAAGNLVRGVPLDAQGNFSMAFFTEFHDARLRWFARLVHRLGCRLRRCGAGGCTARPTSRSKQKDRCMTDAHNGRERLWVAVVPLFVAITLSNRGKCAPSLAQDAIERPICWIGLLSIIASASR